MRGWVCVFCFPGGRDCGGWGCRRDVDVNTKQNNPTLALKKKVHCYFLVHRNRVQPIWGLCHYLCREGMKRSYLSMLLLFLFSF